MLCEVPWLDFIPIFPQEFSVGKPSDAIFDDYTRFGPCGGWPGPGDAGHGVYVLNPMKEFVDSHSAHVDEAFEAFKGQHGKEYRHRDDHENRKDIFRQNLRFVHSHNRKGLSYKVH